ncbi:MMPL domain protein [Catenulispora acidiphila DSM 44928]|uniref:MMPL domain protein n=1 Tax=Catenulispora acidiphila (strain DSM 44928 / JCM 14897 / NBRC 102108 / NRRL B-24433 / ID139908) TaxID=479433 RepID=C7QC33_CATAD|nr:MMPL family transporter [Catenulispora acidiphila]ACU72652.1 MMPL domain protein [Catenulispora acidiphila DSM 44928]
MSALARWCYQHRFIVITAWVALLIGLALVSQAMRTTYDNSLTLPGTDSGSAQQLLVRSAPAQAGDADQIVWRVGAGRVTDPAVEQRISGMLSQVSHLPAVASVASPYLPGGEVQVSPDGRAAYATVTFTEQADDLDHADVDRVIATVTAARGPGLAVELGGKAIAGAEETTASNASLIGIGAAAVILLVVFGSLLAMALPIVTAAAGVGSGLMLMAPLSHLMSVNGIAPILGALIGLGVGVDYALFIVTRHRRGLRSGMDPEQSAVQALNTSGRAVLFAGGTVCIALLGLLTVGQQFIDGLAVPAAITVVCTVVAAVTLLPALFGVLRLRVLSRGQRRRLRADELGHEADGGGMWARWSRVVPRFPAVLASLGVAVMLAVSAPVLHLRLGFSDASNDPTSTHTHKAYEMLAEGFGPGFNGPLLLVAQTQSAADRAALDRLDHALAAVPGVAAVQTSPAQTSPAQTASGAGPTIEVTQVLPTTAPEDKATSKLIDHLRDTVIPRYTQGTTLRVHVGGLTATFIDFAAVTSAKLPWLLATIMGFSFLLLVLAFRSLLIPAITAVLNLLAAAAAFGVLTAFFQWGWGTGAFGLGARSPIEGYLPELVLAVLFGLSMDYQVFLVSRMAEEWSRTADNARSVLAGVTDTARVITAAAMIMIAVFTAFVFMGQRGVAEFGVGLAAAVALDAFVLRTVLVPAVMYLCGRANWWLPRWLDRRLPHLAIEPLAAEQPADVPTSALV